MNNGCNPLYALTFEQLEIWVTGTCSLTQNKWSIFPAQAGVTLVTCYLLLVNCYLLLDT